MGQAKVRGTREARVAEALAQQARASAPPEITCNACGAQLPEVSELDASSLPGIDAAFVAHCTPCDQDTWAVRGDVPAVKAFYAALEKASGTPVQMGTSKPGG